MPSDLNEDLPAAVAILLVGMFVPALVATVARDLLSMYLTVRQFVLVFAVAFGVVSWLLIELLEIDRTTFFLASIVVPWPVLLASLFGVLLLNQGEQIPRGPVADVFRYLIGDVGSFLGYGAMFMLVGVGAVGVSKKFHELSERNERVPEARVVFAGVGLAVVLVVVLAVGMNLVAASAASVSALESGIEDHRSPALIATVEGSPAELRVTTVAPDGTSVTKRLSRVDMRGGTGTAAFRVRADDSPPPRVLPVQSGTYRVRVTSLSGVTVDTAEFTAEEGSAVSITDTETASGTLSWDDPPERIVEKGGADTKVGIVVENEGTFQSVVSVGLFAPDYRSFHEVFLTPGERTGVVFSIPDDTVEMIRTEGDGVVTVRVDLTGGETISTVEVELPEGGAAEQ